MFTVNDDLSIYATRGDIVFFSVTAADNGGNYEFQPGDVVRIKVFGKKDAENVVLQKDFPVIAKTEAVEIFLTEQDTKIGEVISKPKDYWYEVELNPYDNPQTIIGYDEDGPKVFRLMPEGKDVPDFVVDPEDIPVVDAELDMVSTRPVQNQAVSRAFVSLRADYEETKEDITTRAERMAESVAQAEIDLKTERARIDNLVSHSPTTLSKTLEYLDFITETTKAKIDGHIDSDGVFATLKINLREANLVYCGSEMDVFIIPNECRPIELGLIHAEDGLEYIINYDTTNRRYYLTLRAQDTIAPSGAGSVNVTYALADYELKDVRVGCDGTVYESAGTAVREQLKGAFITYSRPFSYTVSESSTPSIDMVIGGESRYRLTCYFGDNVSALDIGYTKFDGTDVLLVDNALSGHVYEFTLKDAGTRLRFWTYLKESVDTNVSGTISHMGFYERATKVENRLYDNEAALYGYKARVTKDSFTIAQGFTLDQFYKIKPGKKFYVSFDSFNYDAIDKLNLYCNHAGGNEIFHDSLIPVIGEFYECYTENESVLNIYIFPTETGGKVDFTMSIYDENGIGKRIHFNEKDIDNLRATQDQVGLPYYEEHRKKFTVTDAWDIEFPTADDAKYVFKAEDYAGSNLSELQLYAFNSMQDYVQIKKGVQIGDTVEFNGNSAYKYFRVYAVISGTEEQGEVLTIKLAEYNANSIIARLEVLEDASKNSGKAPNVLIIGDSYSQMGYWINELKNIVSLGDVVNLGVSSATLKDRYTDRTKYPYDSRPVMNDPRGGNVNTFGSQIEKLKRLMLGADLDSGEKKVDTIPDIILIEGGTNDAVDSTTDNYLSQIYTVEKAYIARKSDTAGYMGYIKIPTAYEDTDRTTFGGAMRYLYGALHDMFPDALIFFVTPCGLTYMSGGEHKYLEKGEQIKYAASLLGIPVIDWGVNGRLSVCDNAIKGSGTQTDPYIYDAAGEFSLDALHPNSKGAHFLAMEVAKVLRDYNLVSYK